MSQRSQTNDDLDLGAVFSAMGRAFPFVLIVSIIFAGLTYFVLSMVAPRYTSETQLTIESKRTDPFPDKATQTVQQDNLLPRLDREAINTRVKALGAPELLLRVAEKLELAKLPEFNPKIGSASQLDSLLRSFGFGSADSRMSDNDHVLEAIKDRLQVAAARETRYISIKFSSSDPQLAARFANTLAATYRQGLVDTSVRETEDVVSALSPKIEQLNREVVEAEAALERFRAKTDRLLSGSQQIPLSSQRLGQLSEELSRAEAARSEAQSRWKTARDLSKSGSGEVLPEVQQSNTVQGLINQRVRLERQISEASAALLPAHPRMRQLNSDLAGLQRSIRSEVSKVVQSLEKAYRAAQIRVDDIARQLSELKARVVDTSGDDAQVRVLEAQARSKRSELQRLQRQIEDNKTVVATRSVPVEAEIVSQARPSAQVTFPKKGPISLLVGAATMMLGMMFTVARTLISGGANPIDGSPGRDRAPAPSHEHSRDDMIPSRAAPEPQNEPREQVVFGKAGTPTPKQSKSFADHLAGASGFAKDRLSSVASGVRGGAPVQNDASDFDDEDDYDAPGGLTDIAEHIRGRAEAGVGYRTMVAGESGRINAVEEAVDLVTLIAKAGDQVLLIDCSTDGEGQFDLPAEQPGFSDLVAGTASFEDAITNLEGSVAHFMGCGSPVRDAGLDAENANLVLDALDEAYDHIVVVGDYGAARQLFEIIQGRFDAGIVVAETSRQMSVLEESENSFLGFEVTDIDIVRYQRMQGSAFASRRMELGGAETPAGR